MLKKFLIANVRRLHRDERGAEGLEKLLIIGAIVLPLLGILIFFKEEITTWLESIWGSVRDETADDYEYDGGGF